MKHGAGLWCAAFTLLGVSTAFAQGAPAGSNLQAGGLKPPDAVQSDPSTATPSSQTDALLDRADKEDSGRGLEFVFLNAEVGPQYLGLHTFKANGLVDGSDVKSKGAGMAYGAGLGVRYLAFTVGARFRLGNFSDWQLWTLDAEAGMHIPLGRLEPYFTFAAGYASLGAFDKNLPVVPKNAHGLDLRAAVGVDYYLTNSFSIGGNVSGDFLYLSRSSSNTFLLPVGAPPVDPTYNKDGSGIGAGATFSAVLGLHF
jgi:hypothetical protein